MSGAAIEAVRGTRVRIGGRELVYFGGCDYLGLRTHPEVLAAAANGLERFGLSAAASRTTSGSTSEHEALEEELARAFDAPAAVLTSDGYLANLACAAALHGPGSRAVLDPDAHVSIRDAVRTAGAAIDERPRPALAESLSPGDVLWTDGVYPSEGHVAPVRELESAARRAGAYLVVDDCHGFGVLGARGLGTCEGLEPEHMAITLTLSKSLGCAGGAVVCCAELAERIRRAPAYLGATPVPAALCAAARAALRVLLEDGTRRAQLHTNTRRARVAFERAGLPVPETELPVLAIVPEDEAHAERLAHAFDRADLFVPRIRYPGGPADAYFRLAVTAAHEPDDLARLERALSG